MIISDVKEWI